MTKIQSAVLRARLTQLSLQHDGVVFHHGDCVGSDMEAHEVARDIAAWVIVHPPVDSKERAFCRGDEILPVHSYGERNRAIVRDSEVLIACPKEYTNVRRGSGTWWTIRIAQRAGRSVHVIWPNGQREDLGAVNVSSYPKDGV